jgi:hypothetical protein
MTKKEMIIACIDARFEGKTLPDNAVDWLIVELCAARQAIHDNCTVVYNGKEMIQDWAKQVLG